MREKAILVVQIDGKLPNLALEKVKKFYRDKGYKIYENFPLAVPYVERIFVSCIFTWNRRKAEVWRQYPHAEIGGSGVDLTKNLPPEIEAVKPKINLGFTTRGCIRKCPFCIVPKKEGYIRTVGDIYDVWDGKSDKITLLDNNILGLREHFFKIIKQLKKERLKVDFNQGLDCRLVDEEVAKALSGVRHEEYKFAFDFVGVEPYVIRTINLLRKHGIRRCTWYVLVGFNTSYEEDLYRLFLLRRLGQNAYVQRYNYWDNPKVQNKFYIAMARWANQHHIYQGMTFSHFLRKARYIENPQIRDLFGKILKLEREVFGRHMI